MKHANTSQFEDARLLEHRLGPTKTTLALMEVLLIADPASGVTQFEDCSGLWVSELRLAGYGNNDIGRLVSNRRNLAE